MGVRVCKSVFLILLISISILTIFHSYDIISEWYVICMNLTSCVNFWSQPCPFARHGECVRVLQNLKLVKILIGPIYCKFRRFWTFQIYARAFLCVPSIPMVLIQVFHLYCVAHTILSKICHYGFYLNVLSPILSSCHVCVMDSLHVSDLLLYVFNQKTGTSIVDCPHRFSCCSLRSNIYV